MLKFRSQICARFAAGAVFYLLLCLFVPLLDAQQLAPGVSQVGTIQHFAINESSGLIESRRYPGTYWTHNDGGEQFIFAINQSGQHLGAFQVRGANMIDWEAISTDFSGNLYFADIGINGMGRSHAAIHRAAEPNPSDRIGPADVNKTWYVRFAFSRPDCESFFVYNGYGYLITKEPYNGVVGMYRFNLSDNSESILVESVANIPVPASVADAAISQDGTRLGLITGDGLVIIHINGNPFAAGTAPRATIRYDNNSQEGGTFTYNGFLVTLDGFPQILLYNAPAVTGAPSFTTPLIDIFSYLGKTVTFSASSTGFPAVRYEWRFNGQLISGQTSSNLVLTNVTAAQAGVYTVTAINSNGSASSSARLVLGPRQPDVQITEIMSVPATNLVGFADWFELTNFDSVPADLSGWRFNDDSGGFADAFTISNLTIFPGETIVFVDDLSAGDFRDWWGESNMPPFLRIVRYDGSGLGFGANGDTLNIWNATSTNENQVVTSATFGPSAVGVSFSYNPATGLLEPSRVGINGAFRAVAGIDIGSPGIPLRPVPPFYSTPLRNENAFLGGTLELRPTVAGFPPPSFSWRFNGQLLPGQTNSFLLLTNLTQANAGTYVITASNIHGITSSTSVVTIIESPFDLRVTEVMPSPLSNNVAFSDWWELSNFGTNTVNLSGWRFNDAEDPIEESFVFPEGLTISPGEIIIFVDSISSNAFRAWWGNGVPAGTKIVTYTGSGLGLGGSGDTIRLWTRDATSSSSPIVSCQYFDSNDGVSLAYNLATGTFVESRLGIAGAFRASSGADVGSPGIATITSGAPVFLEPLSDQFAFPGSTVQLAATVAGNSPISFTWRFNGGVIPGQTTSTLTLTNVSQANQGTYELTASNTLGVATSSAVVTIGSAGINVQITEVMSSPAPGNPVLTADWWELSNFGTETLDLTGWKFNDGEGALTDPYVFPAGTTIEGGETIIFVEGISASDFRAWWGTANLPPNVRIFTYAGSSLSFGASGDSVILWNASNAEVDRVRFGVADAGVTFTYNGGNEDLIKSRLGVNGAFAAANGGDIGSPGLSGVTAGPPVFVVELQDQTAFEGSTVTLSAQATGLPAPVYTWRFQGQILSGQTSSTLVLSNVSSANAGIYELTASNIHGVDFTSARLDVTARAYDLRITEVMSSPVSNTVAFSDWWELSNFGSQPVDLNGWRFNDRDGGVSVAYVFNQSIIIEPGESIVFAEELTADQFRAWWGNANFTPSAKIITYSGSGLSFGSDGDSIFLWDNASREVTSAAFGLADPGVSFSYDPSSQTLVKSQVGVNGAFRAVAGPDVGSPGRAAVIQAAPVFTTPLTNQSVTAGTTLELRATASGFPAPTYSWRFNNDLLPGQNSAVLVLPNVTSANSGNYELTASNELGVAVTSAQVTVIDDANPLKITEVMSSPADGTIEVADWWELSNFGSQSIDLSGWRFNDNAGGFTDAFLIPGGTIIEPGESIVFVDELTRDDFIFWWGAGNLAPNAKIVTFSGTGLSFGAAGDSVLLWDATETDEGNPRARADFGAAQEGASFSYDQQSNQLTISQIGVNGAIRASNSTDIGSPTRVVIGEAAPVFTTTLQDAQVVEGATFRFTALASGSPTPAYSWTFNNQLLAGQTSPTLTLTNVSFAQAGTYRVIASNRLGSITQSAVLTITARLANLRITEVMSDPASNSIPVSDWWELSNFGSQVVDLSGWRFNDNSGGLTDPYVFPAGMNIQPGESIILVQDITPEEFRAWWGTSLSAGTRVFSYTHSGIGLGQTGDSVILWDNVATSETAYIDRVDFGPADGGVSFTYNPAAQLLEESVLGVNGVVQAQNGRDIGSPGVEPSISGTSFTLDATRNGSGIRIQFNAEAGETYLLQESSDLVIWNSTGITLTPTADGPAFFDQPATGQPRFFRVVQQ